MSAESGRRPVLATLNAAQVPLLGPVSALRGLSAGIESALHLAQFHTPADVLKFDTVLHVIRSGGLYDLDFSQAFASGYSLVASEVRRIGGVR